MSFGALIKKLWQNPLARGLDLEDPAHVHAHAKILRSNRLLRDCYARWYRELLPAVEQTKDVGGDLIELGSGVGFLDEFIPSLVKTDATPSPFATRILDATKMDLPDESVRAFFMIAVFHHLPDPKAFLSEAQRCLRPGGRLVLIEPNNSMPERLLCKLLDHYEYFDENVPDWDNSRAGNLVNANLALAWMVFLRDRALLESRYPRMKVRGVRYHTFASYIVSGGMSYRPFVPPFMSPLVGAGEALMRPLGRWLATAMTIDLVKLP